MLGEVPTRTARPPTSEPNDIGISSRPGATPVLRAMRRAEGIISARAPTFLVTIDSKVVAVASTGHLGAFVLQARQQRGHQGVDQARPRDRGAQHQGAGDDDDDVVGKAREGRLDRDQPEHHAHREGAESDQVVAPAPPDETQHGRADQAEGQSLLQSHAPSPRLAATSLAHANNGRGGVPFTAPRPPAATTRHMNGRQRRPLGTFSQGGALWPPSGRVGAPDKNIVGVKITEAHSSRPGRPGHRRRRPPGRPGPVLAVHQPAPGQPGPPHRSRRPQRRSDPRRGHPACAASSARSAAWRPTIAGRTACRCASAPTWTPVSIA